MNYQIEFTRQAKKDYEKVKRSPHAKKLKQLLKIVQQNPFTPPYEALGNELKGLYSRRINKKHRLVYRIVKKKIIIVSVWSHYEKI